MIKQSFNAFLVSENDGKYTGNIVKRETSELPEGDVLIEVKYSSLNYKDFLSASGNKGVTRNYPHTPGIDAAGIIIESNTDTFKVGEEVLVTGYDLGMNTSGGYGEYIRVPSNWVVRLPKNLSLRESMIIGTAGFTAALSVDKIVNAGVKPADGEILVTGATGGVGSLAIKILSHLGYQVVAATGKLDEREMLISMGAKDVISREDIDDASGRPLLRPRWMGVVDTVGGNILSTAIKSTHYNGHVTNCGLVQSSDFSSSVFPFILKGITLHGIDSVMAPMDTRVRLWDLLATSWKPANLESFTSEVNLEGLEEQMNKIGKGQIKGRVLVNVAQ